MAYSITNMLAPGGLGGTLSCKEQHAAWEKERLRIEVLAAELGEDARACVAKKAEYEKASAQRLADLQANSSCAESLQAWDIANTNFAKNSICQKYLQAKADYAKLISDMNAGNAKIKALYDKQVAEVSAKNKALAADYGSAMASYAQTVLAWEEKTKVYQNWLSAMGGQATGIGLEWAAKLKQYPVLANYNWPYKTSRCHTTQFCMTQSVKNNLKNQCTVVRGTDGLGALGATKPDATLCMDYQFMPTCPTVCPPYVANPGAKPAPPAQPTPFPMPKEPVYMSAPEWGAWLKAKTGLGTNLEGCNPNQYPNPGAKPTCNPNGPVSDVPAQPGCSVPNIPEIPAAPTCKPSFFEQVGPMWLLLAAGAGGLYWYSKKK